MRFDVHVYFPDAHIIARPVPYQVSVRAGYRDSDCYQSTTLRRCRSIDRCYVARLSTAAAFT